jgi:hypothetical protein
MKPGKYTSYCEALGIQAPSLEAAKNNPSANSYSLLIVALLERGAPMTLEEAARRFEEAGIAPAYRALESLQRCRPGRPPIYRDGSLYALDPHDQEADRWAFRLGLRPPKVAVLPVVRPDPGPLPSPDQPLSIAGLDEAWREGVPANWSAQRIAICVLDAHRKAMAPDDVLAFVRTRSRWSPLSTDSASHWREGAAIRVRDDGLWELHAEHDAIPSARQAVRERIVKIRRWYQGRPDPSAVEAARKHFELERETNAGRLAEMRRILIHAFPAKKPEAVVLVDAGRREVTTFIGEEIAKATETLAGFDIIAAIDVRALLRSVNFDPGQRRLADLAPPQKTKQLNKRGRTLKITTSLLIQGSCGIGHPFAGEEVLRQYLRDGDYTKLRRRLEADAKSLFALYQYGCLHGAVRLRWGFLDEMIPAPWVHPDELTLHTLMRKAHELGVPLEIVAGSAPGWADPWSRVQRVHVERDETGWPLWLVTEGGDAIDKEEVQLARSA